MHSRSWGKGVSSTKFTLNFNFPPVSLTLFAYSLYLLVNRLTLSCTSQSHDISYRLQDGFFYGLNYINLSNNKNLADMKRKLDIMA